MKIYNSEKEVNDSMDALKRALPKLDFSVVDRNTKQKTYAISVYDKSKDTKVFW